MTHDPRPAPATGTTAARPVQLVDGTTPYPWPFDEQLDAARLALVIVMPSGPAPGITLDDGAAALAAITELALAVEAYSALVLHVSTAGPLVRRGPVTGTSGTAVGGDSWSPPTALPYSAQHLSSAGIDGFFGSQLDVTLQRARITHLLLAGLPVETAVHSTMRDANDQGYECLLVRDATAALDSALLDNTISMIEMSGGIFGAVGTRAAVIAALTR
ncbi:MAG: cysteine hydrolase family protein [Candidatus Nanopelagicales bacterium]|nr:cysteine hydrolase family protein [Candidatus Nanopelagicales bacterium]